MLDGEITAHYFAAHDLIIDILNECPSDNPDELEIRSLYNDLISYKYGDYILDGYPFYKLNADTSLKTINDACTWSSIRSYTGPDHYNYIGADSIYSSEDSSQDTKTYMKE